MTITKAIPIFAIIVALFGCGGNGGEQSTSSTNTDAPTPLPSDTGNSPAGGSACAIQPCPATPPPPPAVTPAHVSGPYAFDVPQGTQVLMHLRRSEFAATNNGTSSGIGLGVTADEKVGVFWRILGTNLGTPTFSNAGAIIDKSGGLLALRMNFFTFSPVFSESGIVAAAGILNADQFDVESSVPLQNAPNDWFSTSRGYTVLSYEYGVSVSSVMLSPKGSVSWLVSKNKLIFDSGSGLFQYVGSTVYLSSVDSTANKLPDIVVDDFNFVPGKYFTPAKAIRSSAENNEQLVVWEGLDESSNRALRGMIIHAESGEKSPAFTVRAIPNEVVQISGLSVAYSPSGYGAVVWTECTPTQQTRNCGVHGVHIAKSTQSFAIGSPVVFAEDGVNTLANIDSSGRAVAVWASKKVNSSTGIGLYKYESSISDSYGNWQPKETLFASAPDSLAFGDSVFMNEINGVSSAGHIVVTTKAVTGSGFSDAYSARYIRKYVPGTGWLPVQQVFSSGYTYAVRVAVGPTGLGAISYIASSYCSMGDASCGQDDLYVMAGTF